MKLLNHNISLLECRRDIDSRLADELARAVSHRDRLVATVGRPGALVTRESMRLLADAQREVDRVLRLRMHSARALHEAERAMETPMRPLTDGEWRYLHRELRRIDGGRHEMVHLVDVRRLAREHAWRAPLTPRGRS